MEILKVINKGMYTSIQDLGRFGYKQFGVPQSGAMDSYAARAANILVNNDENTPVIEVTYGVFKCVFLNEAAISLTGGDLGGVLNGRPLDVWQTVRVKKNDVLEFRGGKHLRCYIAINNGISCEKYLRSCSTYERAGFGKPIEDGQVIYGKKSSLEGIKIAKPEDIPIYDNNIRFIKGPHKNFFYKEHLERFTDGEYSVTAASDRMGIRLQGEMILTKSRSLISCPLPVGAIQMPPSGQPIVIMADGQVTGGYPIIGCVISSDIGKLAQIKPNHRVFFKEATSEQAVAVKKEKERNLKALKDRKFKQFSYKQFNVKVDEKDYYVQVYE